MTQALIHKLAERVLFNKNGGSSKQKSAIYQNVKAIRKALKDPQDRLVLLSDVLFFFAYDLNQFIKSSSKVKLYLFFILHPLYTFHIHK